MRAKDAKDDKMLIAPEHIQKYQNDSAFQIAQIYAYRGETDKAFE